MNWFIVKIVYEIICGDGRHCAQFDEQLRLVYADGLHEAFQHANAIGRQEAVCFQNDKQQLVQWKFLAVPEVLPLVDLMHGAEVFSRIREVDYVEQYKSVLLTRAEALSQNQPTCQPYHSLT
ncbi:DUF4288 domain-containing protein [Flavihumibacter fluvii]|uniref:DUF4288 domain-containing protein n=1 Tax=Flavihumibacter fluvii TaxID=2838157 RepID=UPI001BDE5CCC|nr:DUF4288 domain-containing protein [Flavihumibacter fluvii]ULQ51018.1 DUF4288 domain-containing protein [Flavihumibacter fluvii]